MSRRHVQHLFSAYIDGTLSPDARRFVESHLTLCSGCAQELAQWRAGNQNIDPEAESTMVMQMIGQIEQELNTARINYQKIVALGNPDHPLLKPAHDQVATTIDGRNVQLL